MQLARVHLTCYLQSAGELIKIINSQKYFITAYDVMTVDSDTFNLLVQWIDWKTANKDAVTIRVETNSCSVFSNDLKLLETLTKITDSIKLTEALLTEDPSVIALNNPKHKFRVYLKNKVPSVGFHNELDEFLNIHKASLFPCKALLSWIYYTKNPRRGMWIAKWLSNSHFIEYDDESTFTLLKLYLGNVFGKNYKVVKR